ncbi:MAG: hypothetical protein QW507_02470 [Candidatus Nanoarchaeia archaeon]|nr:hypothetical protein [Candidatus Haiyanarchaeum thermophilum]MCW1303286.1 hypothetical protein [Candidatus Haiyanarchaeum thermophilum]MCW1303982.1 hypothetical protein [Candidatus Haiyanarchaeum thermophilum]MCW1306445.1 hypothetical protein [Candidatus Haiyanarchaeum thermophilum]MCW1307257.1 hypothetical protein [Candidatus Haiyanarchaeum thermophilum]
MKKGGIFKLIVLLILIGILALFIFHPKVRELIIEFFSGILSSLRNLARLP